ncbi:helix-turn-helix domain-containing protein [Actinomadura sp. NPDC048955]|uniref:helix-turn-helix domain-containing protein n=1 Tax=Actinomadura sp. NPDC048955 TaxID=3158228 RepID=UPI0033DDB5CB
MNDDATRVLPLASWGHDPNITSTAPLSDYLGIAGQTIRAMVARGEIPAQKIGKDLVYYRPAVMRALSGERVAISSEEIVCPLEPGRDPNVLKLQDIAVRLGVRSRTLIKAHEEGFLPGLKIGTKTILFYYPAVIRWLSGQSRNLLIDRDIEFSVEEVDQSDLKSVGAKSLSELWRVARGVIANAANEEVLPGWLNRRKRSFSFEVFLRQYRACIVRLVPDDPAFRLAPNFDQIHQVVDLPAALQDGSHSVMHGYAVKLATGKEQVFFFFLHRDSASIFADASAKAFGVDSCSLVQAACEERFEPDIARSATTLYLKRDEIETRYSG